MYVPSRRYLLHMAATGNPGAIVQVPWNNQDPIQNLACWIYSADQGLPLQLPNGGIPTAEVGTNLGGGSAQVFVAGVALGSPTAFPSAPSMILPANIITVGSDAQFEIIHPQTTNPGGTLGRLQGIYRNGVFDNSSDEFKGVWASYSPVKTFVLITNTDAAPKDIIVEWVGISWPST